MNHRSKQNAPISFIHWLCHCERHPPSSLWNISCPLNILAQWPWRQKLLIFNVQGLVIFSFSNRFLPLEVESRALCMQALPLNYILSCVSSRFMRIDFTHPIWLSFQPGVLKIDCEKQCSGTLWCTPCLCAHSQHCGASGNTVRTPLPHKTVHSHPEDLPVCSCGIWKRSHVSLLGNAFCWGGCCALCGPLDSIFLAEQSAKSKSMCFPMSHLLFVYPCDSRVCMSA